MNCTVGSNTRVAQSYFKLGLELPLGAPTPRPGQFYNVRCGNGLDPLFRRPLSVHRILPSRAATRLEILYRVVGKGTEWLSHRCAGEGLELLGPLGNGFILDRAGTDVVLVARGIGVAPLYAVGEAIRARDPGARIAVLMGARIKQRIFYEEELRRIGSLHLYTDDGSAGFHGNGPELFRHLLTRGELPVGASVYACGPAEMLKDLAEVSRRFGCPGQVALEAHMECGFGACLSCACSLKPAEVRTGAPWKKPALQWSEDRTEVYSLICKDGPVYDIQEVDWDAWLA